MRVQVDVVLLMVKAEFTQWMADSGYQPKHASFGIGKDANLAFSAIRSTSFPWLSYICQDEGACHTCRGVNHFYHKGT